MLVNYYLTMPKTTFSDWLVEARKSAGLYQEELADMVGCTKAYISMLERNVIASKGGRPIQPSLELVDKIAQALGRSKAEARAAANWAAPKLDETTARRLSESRFGLLLEKYETLKKTDKDCVDRFLDMLEYELNKRLPEALTEAGKIKAQRLTSGKG